MHFEKEELEQVNLNDVLQIVRQEMQEITEKTGTQINATRLPTVKGVQNHLVYLFRNLVSNSIKFQPAGNQPRIDITASMISRFVNIHFADNGLGFAPEYSKKIFQMFRRLHGKTEFDGTGMGLAICKRVMEKHGGTITAQGEPGAGAVFTCSFPAAAVH